jgi:hypothetical protein
MVALFALTADSAAAQGPLVIVKEGRDQYHRPGCSVVREARDVIAMTVGQAESRGLKPHPECDPSKTPSAPPASPVPAASSFRKPLPVFVQVDAAGKFYHRDGCQKLGKDAKKVALEVAGKKYWPCTACKPPIRRRPG